MKLRSLRLRNYRVHRALDVAFDERCTLIGGPNESGKSTLVEALHRGFFLKAKGQTEWHRAMRSSFGGEAEVEIGFQIRGTEYHLHKRFGTRGSTVLSAAGHPAETGEAAEAALAALLGLGEPVAAREAVLQWAHLWVRQGRSGSNPCSEATAQQAPLLPRLREMAGAVALQSDSDMAFAAEFREERERIFRADGKAKAGSPWECAQKEAQAALLEKESAEEQVRRFEVAIADFTRASEARQAAETRLKSFSLEAKAVEERAARIAVVRGEVEEAERKHAAVENQHRECAALVLRLAEREGDLRSARASLEPQTAELESRHLAAERARLRAAQAASVAAAADLEVRQARHVRDLQAQNLSWLEKQAFLAEAQTRLEKIAVLKSERAQWRDKLAKLLPVTEKMLAGLRALDAARASAETTLATLAAGLEVLVTDRPVFCGNDALPIGKMVILVDETEILIGDSVRLRIHPGGGSDLPAAKEAQKNASLAWQQALQEARVGSLEEAAEIVRERSAGQAREEAFLQALQAWDPENLPLKIARLHEETAALAFDLQQQMAGSPDLILARDLVAAGADFLRSQERLSEAEKKENGALVERDSAQRAAQAADIASATQRENLEKLRLRVRDLETTLRHEAETHGDADFGAKRQAQLENEKRSALTFLREKQAALARLGPAQVTAEATRWQSASAAEQQAILEAAAQRAHALGMLTSEGREDPQAALACARSRCTRAEERLAATRRDAEAIRLLHTLFEAEQRGLAGRFTEPLAATISNYLPGLFGEGTRAEVAFGSEGFQELSLVRPWPEGGTFPFEDLSGGTREQVAAAMRLALAEVLCTDFGGCLPVIFDDAFAYADPERGSKLQRMLEVAAERGLQVIILTCHPADYRDLVARQIALPGVMIRGRAEAVL